MTEQALIHASCLIYYPT